MCDCCFNRRIPESTPDVYIVKPAGMFRYSILITAIR